ncbi:MAG: selenide, water dikinase SelD [Lachnospiraceae bacterium]
MNQTESILSSCTSGGCGAKIGPGELAFALEGLTGIQDKNLLVGYDTSDDAAVYAVSEDLSIISTVDFFSPMVEDPRIFGRIAAANALSDVYAMGGTPKLALNLVCFPEAYPKSLLKEILAGGAEKIAEAGAVIGGGHSIYDKELKYGLAVTGMVGRNHMIRNSTPQIGDKLILTKPLGIGIIMAAHRGNMADRQAVQTATDTMQRLNRYAAEKMMPYKVNACTDITGFGLLAHLLEMCGKNVSAEISVKNVPVISEALLYAEEYLITAAGQRNRNYVGQQEMIAKLPFAMQELLFDPQTSGGLLICVEAEEADRLLADIRRDDPRASIIGTILPRTDTTILFA